MNISRTTSDIIKNNNFTNNRVKPFPVHNKQDYASMSVNLVCFHPSFGMRNPVAALYRAKQLQAKYAQEGFGYLLPHEIWSDKKIMKTIRNFSKTLDKLTEKGTLCKETVQEAIVSILPEHAKGRIKVKDFSDLDSDLKEFKEFSSDDINRLLKYGGLHLCDNAGNSVLYIKFSKHQTIKLKMAIEHELKHALSALLQNTAQTHLHRNEAVGGKYVFNKIFGIFQENFNSKQGRSITNFSTESLLNEHDIPSIEKLHEKFKTVLTNIILQERKSGTFNISSEKGWKQFFHYLRYKAKDEKEAYQSTKRYREAWGCTNIPTNAELMPLLYREMEIFFAKKEYEWRDLNKK